MVSKFGGYPVGENRTFGPIASSVIVQGIPFNGELVLYHLKMVQQVGQIDCIAVIMSSGCHRHKIRPIMTRPSSAWVVSGVPSEI